VKEVYITALACEIKLDEFGGMLAAAIGAVAEVRAVWMQLQATANENFY